MRGELDSWARWSKGWKGFFLEVKVLVLCSIPPRGTPVIQLGIGDTEFKTFPFVIGVFSVNQFRFGKNRRIPCLFIYGSEFFYGIER
jgi:hypothetical protein